MVRICYLKKWAPKKKGVGYEPLGMSQLRKAPVAVEARVALRQKTGNVLRALLSAGGVRG